MTPHPDRCRDGQDQSEHESRLNDAPTALPTQVVPSGVCGRGEDIHDSGDRRRVAATRVRDGFSMGSSCTPTERRVRERRARS
jgi:hypothetical protein